MNQTRYIRQIRLFPQHIQIMSFIFIAVSRTWKSLTPKDVTAVKGLWTRNLDERAASKKNSTQALR
jgi:hypothetical protein